MRGRLDKTVRFPVMRVLVDFNDLGFSRIDEWEDITDYVSDVSGSKEKEGETLGGASSDLITFTLDNSENTFSRDNSKGPYYKKIKSNVRFVLKTGFKEEELTNYAIGYVDSFKPRWKGKEYIMSATCPMKKLKKTPVPTNSYQDITWDEAVGILLDTAGIDSFFTRNIPKTEFYFRYLKFEESTCFDSLKKLMEMAVGQAFFEGDEFKVTTKLALDYVLDTKEKHTVIVDDLFEFDENVDDSKIINNVTVKSDYKDIAPLQVVWETPENFTKVTNEQVTYDGSDYVYIDSENLPLYWSEQEDITIKNLTTGVDIEWEVYNAELGRIKLSSTGKANCKTGDLLSLSYTYQLLVLMPGQSRKFVANLQSELASFMEPDVVAWNADVSAQIPYSKTANTSGTISKQSLVLKENGTIIELTLKNNTAGKVAISTLQFRGNPVQVLNPIEVYNKDLPSINEFETQEITLQNNYLNNIKLAEKISQYIVDNNAQPRKNITIQINGYPELLLNDVMKVTEEFSGTDHKFTIERIDYQFSINNGWTVTLNLLQLDTEQWVYESFAGDSYEKSNSGNPTADFIKEINANLVRNGGAELYSGADDVNDIGAIAQVHNIPDYWSFTRSTGNATARVREGGGLVLHGGKSFEITTTNGGEGYFSQIINGIKPSQPYTLSLLAKAQSCTGKAILEQYDSGSTLLKSEQVSISTYTSYELTILSLANTATIVVKLQKDSGGGTTEDIWFDKVKLENSNDASTYIETEETSAVQIGKQYANSLTIGNQYGVEVYDDFDNIKVRLGQYEPKKYGLKIYGGGIEIENGLPKDQIDPKAVADWDSAKSAINNYIADNIISVMEKPSLKSTLDTLTEEYHSLMELAHGYWSEDNQAITDFETAFNGLNDYLTVENDLNNGAPILAPSNKNKDSLIDPLIFDSKFSDFYTYKGNLENQIQLKAKELADNAQNKVDEIEDDLVYKVDVISTKGNTFLNGQIETTVQAIVYRGKNNITDLLQPNQFIWSRISDDPDGDKTWNANHVGVGKEVPVTNADVNVRATFKCDVDVT